MASWFRSMEMQYVSIIVNEDAAHSCINLMGQLGSGVVQFTDLNVGQTAFQRRFVSHIKRCDELERRLAYFQTEILNFALPIQEAGSVDAFLTHGMSAGEVGEPAHRSGLHLLETLEVTLEKYETQLRDLTVYNSTLTEEYNMKVELQEVMLKSQGLMNEVYLPFQASSDADASGGEGASLLEDDPFRQAAGMRFSSLTGVIPSEERSRFERMLFRVTRGNCFPHFMEIEQPLTDPTTGVLMHKMAFLIFFKSQTIEAKIRKICAAFGARLYAVPDLNDKERVRHLVSENAKDMRDARVVLLKNRENRLQLCTVLAQHVTEWKWTVLREKSIYHTLNLFKADVSGMLRAEGWIVDSWIDRARAALRKAHLNMDLGMPSLLEPVPKPWPTPPTHFETNKFTNPFQEIVDTYGVPRYQEANPALFTAATFPFLFGVMYGDIGHGSVILLGGLYLVAMERAFEGKKLGEMLEGVFAFRYFFVLMGAFAVYAGFVYNDFFAIGLNLFGSEYKWAGGDSPTAGDEAEYVSGCDYGDSSCVYSFGVDPAWHISSNELLFFNSMKMKMSVILGITQMTVGIVLKGMNALYFGESLDFFFEFVPMIVFDLAFFGYMVFLIFLKWSINWDERMYMGTCNADNANWPECDGAGYSLAELCPLDYGGEGDGCAPPNLITTLMNMVLSPSEVAEPMYEGQLGVQAVLVLLAVVCVPVLLLAKPLMLRARTAHEHEPSSFSEVQLIDEKDKHLSDAHAHAPAGHGGGGGAHEEHDFSEILIHQAIETIEFVLGMVSNTASYLRLWALSLAHTELATVFWEKAMLSTINMGSPVAIVVGYGVFAAVTFGVLIVMDVLECFLHALRLHWVEFQNKFFKADGHKFMPLSFRRILLAA